MLVCRCILKRLVRRGVLTVNKIHAALLVCSCVLKRLANQFSILAIVFLQVLTALDELAAHVKAWAQRRGVSSALSKGVYQRFKMRFKAHYSPAFAAAQLVDPAFFKVVSGKQCGLHCVGLFCVFVCSVCLCA